MDFQLAFNNTYINGSDDLVLDQTPSHFGITIAIVAVLIITSYTILSCSFPTFESREPFVIPQKIPYFGHGLGLARSGITYYLELR